MGVIVQKFGGSSMADPARIGKAADRVVAARRAGHDVVVVVSAMGRTTDQLLELAAQVTDAPADRERDMLVTAGERIAMALLCMSLGERGCESISFTGSQAGILTNARHQNARIIEVRPIRVEDELGRGKVVVVAGYQGMSYTREITSLGRGGSDTTAVALAAALGAEAVEIYSDVDGVYSADPRRVPSAVHLETLDPDAMLALAEGGARVLAADAVRLAREAGIALYCRATDPADGGGQTLIRRFPPEDPARPRVRAIHGSREDEALWYGPVSGLGAALARAAAVGVEVSLTAGVGETAALVVSRSGPSAWGDLDGWSAVDPVGRVTVAGTALDADPSTTVNVLERIAEAGAELLGISVRAHAITALVRPASVDRAISLLHERVLDRGA